MKANKIEVKLKLLASCIQDSLVKLIHAFYKAMPIVTQQHWQAQL